MCRMCNNVICRMQTKCIWPEDSMIGDIVRYHGTTCNQILFNCAGNTGTTEIRFSTDDITDGITDGTINCLFMSCNVMS